MNSRSILFEGKKFVVERRPAARADGSDAEVVVHPGAAVILPILEDGRVVLVRNERPTVGRALLELPAGTLEPPESALDCAKRELAEETGYRAAHWEALTEFYVSPGISTERMHIYVATELTAGEPDLDPGESLEVVIHTWEEALQAARSGTICDAKTLVGLLYYDRYKLAREGHASR